jgi:hypothetical protein
LRVYLMLCLGSFSSFPPKPWLVWEDQLPNQLGGFKNIFLGSWLPNQSMVLGVWLPFFGESRAWELALHFLGVV